MREMCDDESFAVLTGWFLLSDKVSQNLAVNEDNIPKLERKLDP
jgi:hypothetical protein